MVYPKALTLYGGFPFEKGVTRVRAVKVTLYVDGNLTLWARKYSENIEIQNKQEIKVSGWKY